MTIQKIHNLFDLVYDKFASPYFSDAEKDLILNSAQSSVVESFLPDNNGGVVSPEDSSIIFSNLDDLVHTVYVITSAFSGSNIPRSSVQSELNISSGNTEPWLVVLSVGLDGKPCRYVRHNDNLKFQQNSFKKASLNYPQYTLNNSDFVLNPGTVGLSAEFTLLKRPVDMQLGVQEPELSGRLHNQLISTAIELTGVATRDDALMQIKAIDK